MKELQLQRLKATLERIVDYNSFYAEKLNGLTGGEVKHLQDIQKFPFLTKEDLRLGYPYKYSCAEPANFMRMHMSSGTTGTPLINPYTQHDIRQWGNIMARCYTAAGLNNAAVIQITPSFGLFNGGFGFHYGAETLQAMIIPIGAGRTLLQLQFIKDFNVTAITAIASYPLRLIEVAKQEKFDFRATILTQDAVSCQITDTDIFRP